MSIKLYPESCGDYYPKHWDKENYHKQLNTILNRVDGESLAVSDHTFIPVSLIWKIVESVKSLFGFTDRTDKIRVNAELLKFLCRGEELGYIDNRIVEKLNKNRVSYPTNLTDATVQRLIAQISARHLSRGQGESETHLKTIHATIIDYHRENASDLRPSFWCRFIKSPTLSPERLIDFGDSHLELARQALDARPPEYSIALENLLRAHDAHNSTQQFQQKLWIHLKEFLEKYKSTQAAIQQQTVIQNIIISISSIALKHNEKDKAVGYLNYLMETYPVDDNLRCRIGECYLKHDYYEKAEPFLPLIRNTHISDPEMQDKIGNMYFKQDKISEAQEAYKTALELYRKNKPVLSQKLADIASKLGKINLEKMEGIDLAKASENAIKYYSEAVQFNISQIEYQECLSKAYIQRWEESPANFEEQYGELWRSFITSCEYQVREDHAIIIKKMFTFCADKALAGQKRNIAQEYLSNALKIFDFDQDYVCDTLQKCAENNFVDDILPLLEPWKKQFSNNPLMKEQIGNVYWAKGDKKKAVDHYQEATALFESKKNATQNEGDIQYYSEHISNLTTKVGSYRLSVSEYDKAIEQLEKSVKNNPRKTKELFDAYLKAAEVEGSKSIFTYSLQKHIQLLKKAYETIPQNGEYLNKLLELYIKNNKVEDAVNLFLDMQNQSWISEFTLKGVYVLKIVVKLRELDSKSHALLLLKTLEKAYAADPRNNKIKEELYLQRFLLSQEKAKEAIALEADSDKKIPLFEESIALLLKNIEDGFEGIPDKIQLHQESISNLYALLAEIYIRHVQLDRNLTVADRVAHFASHKADIEKALECYDKAIEQTKADASLHFEKGLILENYDIKPQDAIKEYLLAVQLNNKNPFYNKCLALSYTAYNFDYVNQAKYEANVPEEIREEFNKSYEHWKRNLFLKIKVGSVINPHKFKIEKGWFSTQLTVGK